MSLGKEAKKDKQPELADDSLPMLWILTPTLSAPILEGFGTQLELKEWCEGVYLMSTHLKTGVIVIHQLPKTPETLWLRLLGKGRSQEQAIKEVVALPAGNLQRDDVLDLLGNLKVILEARSNIEPEEQELIMQLSPLYLEKIYAAELVGEQRGEVKGQQELVLRQLTRRVGNVSPELEVRVKLLPLELLEDLGEALLDFSQIEDLISWLDTHK